MMSIIQLFPYFSSQLCSLFLTFLIKLFTHHQCHTRQHLHFSYPWQPPLTPWVTLADHPPCQHPGIITKVYALCLIFFKMLSFFSPFVARQVGMADGEKQNKFSYIWELLNFILLLKNSLPCQPEKFF
jgi:hypothetical protein